MPRSLILCKTPHKLISGSCEHQRTIEQSDRKSEKLIEGSLKEKKESIFFRSWTYPFSTDGHNMLDETSVRAKPFRMSPRQAEILREDIRRLIDLRVIEVGYKESPILCRP